MREIFVTELIKEVLGPRKGFEEEIDENPFNEYITGVLAPANYQPAGERDIENDAVLPVDEHQEKEEGISDVDLNAAQHFSPALDPKNKPPTMGLSFILESERSPEIKMCVTWARYLPILAEEKKEKWRRYPRHAILTVKPDANSIMWIDENGDVVKPDKAEISLHIMVRQKGSPRYVTIFLVNRLRFVGGERLTTEHHVFQPQIRITCSEGTKIVPGLRKLQNDEDEQALSFLYRDKPLLARGHLCSVTWRDVDPEIPPREDVLLDFEKAADYPPFKWLDGESLKVEDSNLFKHPDVRTEFVPLFSIPAPELSFPQAHGNTPELFAERLANIWDTSELRNVLSPIPDAYEQWILKMEAEIDSLYPNDKSTAKNIVGQCRTVLRRMRLGIDTLCKDEKARLAFCFANKAMDKQSRWSARKSPLKWHPFQLAFILMTIESIIEPESKFRNTCDLLWVPTGAGKTEAYLAAVAFTIAYRRRRASGRMIPNSTGAGVSVITRYTLRLLTIQQFRRTLKLVTACEYLRVQELSSGHLTGWRPDACNNAENFLWGSTPFNVGLWVGENVTPNRLKEIWTPTGNIWGALDILKGKPGDGEPAQVLNCPACENILAVPERGLKPGSHTFNFVIKPQDDVGLIQAKNKLPGQTFLNVLVSAANATPLAQQYYTLTISIDSDHFLKSRDVDSLWISIKSFFSKNGCQIELIPARASRPGYFIRYYTGENQQRVEYDFDILCPNSECELHVPWRAGSPMGSVHGSIMNPNDSDDVPFPDRNRPSHVQEPFIMGSKFIADRIPIPALTVDEQVYHRVPAIVVATVDKFARPPFEPKAASLFGNVQYHHGINGYYRLHDHSSGRGDHPSPSGRHNLRFYCQVSPLDPPDLILQDELHLIDGPLGSLVGIYEMAVDFLCGERGGHHTKYLASTATIRKADEQVMSVFMRELQIFPPPGLTANERFFIREGVIHPLQDTLAGRLYVGICAPGRGPLTPLVRIWSRLLQTAWENKENSRIDSFWTLTGYFNAVRELAGARALYRQDIPQRINDTCANPRPLPDDGGIELSGRISSTDLPSVLEFLNTSYPDTADAFFTTSMFGTGVDIPRIGLMVVNGQPKSTSSYIQSTGRVGRNSGALVVTFLRASRPRDLNHYEFFTGYHRQLHRFVEPVTIYPFAPGVIERAAGPVGVFILRNMRVTSTQWYLDDSAGLMADRRNQSSEVLNLPDIFERRSQGQPIQRKPIPGAIKLSMCSKLDKWKSTAASDPKLRYVDYAINTPASFPVVLGDSQHQHKSLPVVYENAPPSLRDIEETTGFET